MASLTKLPISPTISFSSSLSSSSPLKTPRTISFPPKPRKRTSSKVSAKIREIFMPALSSTMTEGKIVSWSKSEGDVLKKGESVVVVESDKADMDVETFYDGILAAIVVNEGESAPVGAPIGLLAETEADIAEAKAKAAAAQSGAPSTVAETVTPSPPTPSTVTPVTGGREGVVTPFAKKLAKKYKVELSGVKGTGPFGRITPEDVEKAVGVVSEKAKTVVVAASASPAIAAAPSATAGSYVEIPGSSVVPFTTMQGAVAKNMMDSLSVPTFRVGYPVLTDALDALYQKVVYIITLLFCLVIILNHYLQR